MSAETPLERAPPAARPASDVAGARAPLIPSDPAPLGERYARYALTVLVLVYVLNFLDRQILSILAERIKADLQISDAQMGYLYGTAFAIFYAVFGIPLGRLADIWDRRKLIALGLTGWSVMTSLSRIARGFTQLALARVGVGVGEASANPAAYSLLADYFPPARRATALGIYSSGIYLGAGLGLGVGGLIVDRWDAAYAAAAPPFGLHGWQVAFLVVGLPGVLLALWVRTLREPPRGGRNAAHHERAANPGREFLGELGAILPPFALLLMLGRGELRRAAANAAIAAGAIAAAAGMTAWLGNPAQWYSLAIGLYAAASWAQSFQLRDPEGFDLIFRNKTLLRASLGFSFLSFTGYGYGFWIVPFLLRTHGATLAKTGLLIGGVTAAGGWLGVTLGGVLADHLRKRSRRGRLMVGVINALGTIPLAIGVLWTPSLNAAFLLCIPLFITTSLWLGPGASSVQDLVPPRLRAVASAVYLLIITFIGLALGPYAIGRMSVAFGGLRPALLCGLAANLIAATILLLAMRHLTRDEERAIRAADTA